MKPINHISIKNNMTVPELVKAMHDSGVMGAGRIGRACNIFEKMMNDQECKVFLGVAGAMVPGGMKNIIIDLLSRVDVFVTTGATLTHDMVEALGYRHYQGNPDADDEKLHKEGIDRMYDSYMPNDVYEKLELFFKEHFEELAQQKKIKDFLKIIGKYLPTDKPSILRTCYDKNIELFCPGIADSGIGLMMWGRIASGKNSNVGVFDDMKDIINISWSSKKNGVIYVGGGLPKNFIQQSMQFSKGATYGIQISTDVPYYGGSSGAPLKEGISWGKLDPQGDYVDVYCDATIAFPLIWAGVKSKIKLFS